MTFVLYQEVTLYEQYSTDACKLAAGLRWGRVCSFQRSQQVLQLLALSDHAKYDSFTVQSHHPPPRSAPLLLSWSYPLTRSKARDPSLTACKSTSNTHLQSPENLASPTDCSYQVKPTSQVEKTTYQRGRYSRDAGSSREAVEISLDSSSRRTVNPGFRESWKPVRSLLTKFISVSQPKLSKCMEAKPSGKDQAKYPLCQHEGLAHVGLMPNLQLRSVPDASGGRQ